MTFMPDKNVRLHLMPVAFGPPLPSTASPPFETLVATISYTTKKDAVAQLLPHWFEPTDEPVVNVNYERLLGMGWMGGRNYNIVSVFVSVHSKATDEKITAPCSLVAWESDWAPVMLGREFNGIPKMYAEIPDVDIAVPNFTFGCSEYGTQLVKGTLTDMKEVSDQAELATWLEEGKLSGRLHWKYIPGIDGQPDADYPTIYYRSSRYMQVWKGAGKVKFYQPNNRAAPYSGRIARALAELPILEYQDGVASHAVDVVLRRDLARRLDRPASKA